MINKKIKSTATGIIESSLIEVSTLLLAINPGKAEKELLPLVLNGIATPVEIQGGPSSFTVFTGESLNPARLCYIRVNPANNSISVYGGWWFLGEYIIEPHQRGSAVTYNLYNTASGLSGIIAGFLHKKELAAAKYTLTAMLQKISQRLGSAAYHIE